MRAIVIGSALFLLQVARMFIATVVLSFCLAATAQILEVPVQPGPTYEIYKTSRALIISAEKYESNAAWPDLPESKKNADRLATYLGTHGFDEIVRVEDKKGAELREAIRQFLVSSPADSRSIIYFGGHGSTDPRDKRIGYIVPSDAPDPKTDLAGFRLRAISTVDLQAFSQMAAGRHTLFIADSCLSGALIPSQGGFQTALPGGFPPKTRFWETVAQPRFQIITASEDWERAPPDSKLVDRLIEGLDGAADSFGYGFTTAYNLSIWLRNKALDDDKGTNPLFSSISLFNPAASRAYPDGGDMVFTTRKGATAPIVPTRWFGGPAPARGQVKLYKTQGSVLRPKLVYKSSLLGVFEPSQIFGNIDVEYYKKIGDGTRVIKAMDRLGVPYTAKPAQIAYDVTNAIACHEDIDPIAFKALVIGLIEEGVQIRMIKQYESPFPRNVQANTKDPPRNTARFKTIQVLSAKGGAFETATPISVEQVREMDGCPEWFQN